MYTGHVFPVLLDCNVQIGALGATSNLKGPYVESVTRKGVGAYEIKLQDNYNRLYEVRASFAAAQTGANLDPNVGVVGKAYVITVVGDTDWSTAGLPSGVTAAVGQSIILAALPAAGTGRVKAIVSVAIKSVEVIGDPNLSLAPSNQGAIINIQCFGETSAADTTPIPADPANGSVMYLSIMLSNSSVLINGE